VQPSRPFRIALALAATAAVAFAGSAALDVNGTWSEPRQAVANVLWIVFLVSVLALLVVGVRTFVRQRRLG
jgi:hypothetical protein